LTAVRCPLRLAADTGSVWTCVRKSSSSARVICSGRAGSASRSASHEVKVRSELVATATDPGDFVAVVIRQRAQRLARSRTQTGSMSAK
jgi:hypothetical protein